MVVSNVWKEGVQDVRSVHISVKLIGFTIFFNQW